MKKLKKLSPEMEKAIALFKEHGKLVRYRGGYWAQEKAPMRVLDFMEPDLLAPKDSFGTTTMEALHKRGLIQATEWKAWERGAFVVEYQLIN